MVTKKISKNGLDIKKEMLDRVEPLQEQLPEFLQKTVHDQLKKDGIVIGVSGGVDSALIATLAVQALGPDHVYGLILPEKESSPPGEKNGRRPLEAGGFTFTPIRSSADPSRCFQSRTEREKLFHARTGRVFSGPLQPSRPALLLASFLSPRAEGLDGGIDHGDHDQGEYRRDGHAAYDSGDYAGTITFSNCCASFLARCLVRVKIKTWSVSSWGSSFIRTSYFFSASTG